MRMFRFGIISVFFVAIMLFPSILLGQTTITIGSGSSTNTGTTYPAPYGNWYFGAKHQILILASELNSAGMTAGDISSISFSVDVANGTALTDFTIGMKMTSATEMTVFESGLTTVYGPTNYSESAGWNVHPFIAPFYWDGVSNLLIETCFNNTGFTQNAIMFHSSTSYNSVAMRYADSPGVCGMPVFALSADRPNMQFEWTMPAQAPDANFTSNTTYTCSGDVDFIDLSDFAPTYWEWDFGDGSPLDFTQNPSHTYLVDGTYDVELVVCNAFGCDTLLMTNYITVNTAGGTPLPACTPATTSYCCGFGITNFTFNTINNTTIDGSEGYADNTCIQTTVYAGQSYPVFVTCDQPQPHNVRAWIDYNNDGILAASEMVISEDGVLNVSDLITIPASATLNQPLRMRVAADFELQPPPTACGNVLQGQHEDYTVIIEPNPFPPTANFTSDDTLTCTGTICFTDLSQNVPTAWFWDFGDGSPINNMVNPCHTYTADGVYTVELTVQNANGVDVATYVNYITVNLSGTLTSASCTPNTLAYCCDYGIYQVDLNTISHISGDGSESYQDFSCIANTAIDEGSPYTIDIRTSPSSAQDTKVWIDLNNDGVLDDVAELVFEAYNQFDPSGSITIPMGAAVLNTPLRMRVSSDLVGASITPCYQPQRGQVEDYGIIILPETDPPIADFTASETYTCDSTICFTDLSFAATQWAWDFGDGSPIDNSQNPCHTYTSSGTYTVELTATNPNGNDTETKVNYITIDFNGGCDSLYMPTSGIDYSYTCSGTVFDDGGPFFNYSDNTDGGLVIQPPGALSVTLTFVMFDFRSTGEDTLYVYDGPDYASPLMGGYTSNALPPTLTSSGNAITIRQRSDFNNTDPGFEATWSCIVGIDDALFDAQMSVYPNPADEFITIEYVTNTSAKLILQIHDVTGRLAYELDLGNRKSLLQQVNTTIFDPGVYLLSVVSEHGIRSERIVIRQ